MKTHSRFTKFVFGLLLSITFIAFPLVGVSAPNAFSADHVTVDSNKSFDQVNEAVKSLVAKNGMMIMAQVDQGKMLSMTGLKLNATLYLIGNPVVGKQLFEQNHAVGLYVPLRLFVFGDENGKTHLAYDKPSSLLSQFSNGKIDMVGQMLDQKIEGLATMAAQ